MSDSTNAVEEWASNFPKKATPTYSQRHLFQIKHCGNVEIRVRDGNEEIWADGIDLKTGELLEAKYIEKPNNSPYISGSTIPPFIRIKAVGDVENEFRRYAAVINDPNTPVIALRVIVNIKEAVPFFDGLLQQFNLPGRVVIQ
ncbi:restriction endonuclease fold toxin-2 domain-containing protein [Crocosphaera sp. UHCC 0190]|uniref:restriction endonuclease fold toxin-2 domain-containing protein n=1 Tax=unclassified Crocosphaera TaxID=2623705 RepID=UPI002B1F37AE|nr:MULTISPECIES: restriction endonuclease fold toxin-2 domain-containing protein [unclassified Crocosphaera]MEA5511944.1 restriction endonuclease fold toxin-2 domain-containing protein [Crocosphaera sp. UHCC 0190]MEA5536647.1 restriction endonuclease fold toxin-2 domain-containing protein [Crocosphaera sp. XPORK-15E]